MNPTPPTRTPWMTMRRSVRAPRTGSSFGLGCCVMKSVLLGSSASANEGVTSMMRLFQRIIRPASGASMPAASAAVTTSTTARCHEKRNWPNRRMFSKILRPSSIAVSIVPKSSVVNTTSAAFPGDVGTGSSHGDADIGLAQGRGVVNTVAGDRDDTAVGLEGPDESKFMFGRHPGEHIDARYLTGECVVVEEIEFVAGDRSVGVQSELAGDRGSGSRLVAGGHDDSNSCSVPTRASPLSLTTQVASSRGHPRSHIFATSETTRCWCAPSFRQHEVVAEAPATGTGSI